MLHDNEVISIEEASYHIKPNSCVRRFKLINHLTNFQIIIKNTGATLISCCKLTSGKDDLMMTEVAELITRQDNDENHQINQTQQTSLTKRNQQSIMQLNEFEWQSHVLGLDSISFATNSHHNSTITYQLNCDNSLSMHGKLRSVSHLAYLAPFFFNLNSSNSSIDGHFLHIKGIKLDKLDQSPDNSLSFNLTGNSNDSEFLSFFKSPGRISWCGDEKKCYDLVYTLSGRYAMASLTAILSYGSRRIEVNIQNSLNNYSNQITNALNQQSAITNSNTQNLCKLRVKINQHGISLLPANMYEFKCTYKFYL